MSLETHTMATSILPDFEMGYLENHLAHCIFHALSFELNFFRSEFPFNVYCYYFSFCCESYTGQSVLTLFVTAILKDLAAKFQNEWFCNKEIIIHNIPAYVPIR